MGYFMDNTEKLLRAFIEASGYEIEEIFKNPQVENMIPEMGGPSCWKLLPDDYKVTKNSKGHPVGFLANHDGLGNVTINLPPTDFDFVLDFLDMLSFPSHCVDREDERSKVVDIVKWWKG